MHGAPWLGARWLSCIVLAAGCLSPLHAAPGPGTASLPGDPVNAESPRDPEFGVATDRHGLRRHVAMLQWARRDGGFTRIWSASPIDASGFPEARANPPFPLPSREWLADVRVDGRPLPPDVIAALGEWRALRPDFASLPGNMSATFQPEGDGLGTAANPQSPEVGDLRVTWQALHLPPLAGRIVLEDGAWRVAPAAEPADGGGTASTPEGATSLASGPGRWLDWRVLLVALGVLAAIGFAIARRR
jgi:hypothetical protein